jgi:hypothetical protein
MGLDFTYLGGHTPAVYAFKPITTASSISFLWVCWVEAVPVTPSCVLCALFCVCNFFPCMHSLAAAVHRAKGASSRLGPCAGTSTAVAHSARQGNSHFVPGRRTAGCLACTSSPGASGSMACLGRMHAGRALLYQSCARWRLGVDMVHAMSVRSCVLVHHSVLGTHP